MRYFWHAMIAIGFVAFVVFIFFASSLSNRNSITFLDELPELTEPTITIADPTQGPKDAKVTIVSFGDYQCDACQTADDAITAVAAAYPNDVRIVWKDMPNSSVHEQAINAAVAARCAGKQGKFFEYHAYLFANQGSLSDTIYTQIAEELGLRDGAFTSCYENQETLALIQKSYEEGIALDITATPTIFVNGERFTGTINERALTATVESLIHSL